VLAAWVKAGRSAQRRTALGSGLGMGPVLGVGSIKASWHRGASIDDRRLIGVGVCDTRDRVPTV
jgi:hypothetical protein